MTFFTWTMSLLGRKSATPKLQATAATELPAPAAATPLHSPALSTPHIRTSKHRPELYTSFPWEPPAAPDAQGQDETIRLAIATHTNSTETATLAAWTDLELAHRRAERAATRSTSRRTTRRQRTPEPAPEPPAFLPMLPRAPTSSPLARLPPSPTPCPRPVPPPCFRAAFPYGPALLDAEHPDAKGLRSAVEAVLASIAAQHPSLLTDVIQGPLSLAQTVVGFHVSPRQPAALRGKYFSATSVADAVVRVLRAYGWGEQAFGVGILRSGRIGKRGRMEWVREIGWPTGCDGDDKDGTVAWIYREEGGDQGPLFGPETQWRGLKTWSLGVVPEKEVVEVDSEWEEEETMLQAMQTLREGTVGFGGFGGSMKEMVVDSSDILTEEQLAACIQFSRPWPDHSCCVSPPTGVRSPAEVSSPAEVCSPAGVSSSYRCLLPVGVSRVMMA